MKLTKVNRVVSIVMAAALLLGSVQVMGRTEEEIYNAPELILTQGQQEYDLMEGITYDSDRYELSVSDLGDFDINVVGDYNVSYTLTEEQSSLPEADGVQDTEIPEEAAETVIDTETKDIPEEEMPKAANPDTTINVIEFSRIVKVIQAEETVAETFSDNSGIAVYANAASNYTVNLGTPIWTDTGHTKFTFPQTTITNAGTDPIYSVTISCENGTSTVDDAADIKIQAFGGKGWTFIYQTPKDVDYIQNIIRKIEFTPAAGQQMNVNVTISANETKGFDASNIKDFTYNPANGHYYLRSNATMNWKDAYNKSKEYVYSGHKGYLLTLVYNDDEFQFLNNLGNYFTTLPHIGAARLIKLNGGDVFDVDNLTTYTLSSGTDKIYYTCGPEAGNPYTMAGAVGGQGDQAWECILVGPAGTYDETATGEAQHELIVEFGGYEAAGQQDPGGFKAENEASVQKTNVAPMDAEAELNGIKYAPLADALNDAKANDVIEIIKSTVTPVTDGILKKDVQLKSEGRTNVYTAQVDSKMDVADNGTVTLKDGHIKVSDNGVTLKVQSPADGNTYQITTPQGATDVIVPENAGGDLTPYVMNHSTNDLELKIDDITYFYTNESFDNLTMVYIPDAMYKNERVTKAEVSADKTVTVRLDDGDENTVEIKGNGSAADKVTVERRSSDNKADVKLPSGTKAKVFGHEVDAAPSGGVTVSQKNAADTKYPDRDYVVIAVAGEKVTIDGIEYVAAENDQKFYLGTFKATVTIGNNAEITNGQQQTDIGYLKIYTVKISPKADYDLDQNDFTVTMKESDAGAVKKLNFADVCSVDPADGSITVTIPNVSGDITVSAAAKRQMTTLNVEGLVAGNAKGNFKAVDKSGNTYELTADGSINVNRNEELTLIFTPNDFSNPYFSDLTGEKGESFSVLTALEDTTNNTDLFAGAKTFDWKEKSYEIKYTPTVSDVTLKAVFTPSHIVHVHVTGGTAEVKDTSLLKKEAGADQFQHVIVKDNETVELELKDTTGTTTTYKKAYWSNVDGSDDADVTNQALAGNGTVYTYVTQAAAKPKALNVTFEEGQTVDVKVTHGSLETGNDGVTWNTTGSSAYQTIVKNNGALTVNIKPEDGYGLKSIVVNNVAIDIDAAIQSGELVWNGTTKTYSHTFAKVYQAWNVVIDFEKQHEIVFEDQNGNIINKTEHITVIDGNTIPTAVFTKMQKEADKSKEENESLFVWVEKADQTKIYNDKTVITTQTADVVTLIPVYRTNVVTGADGSVIAADNIIIHVNDVRNLTDTEAKTLANVTAYDTNGVDISNTVTVEPTKLDELRTKNKGTYANALTFMITASGLATSVEVEVTDDNPTITGKTAHTLTFIGKPDTEYTVQKLDENGNPDGSALKFRTNADGKGTATELEKATNYKVSHKTYGSAVGKTSLVDAADIAKQFEDKDANDTTDNGLHNEKEEAKNSNVDVIVDDDGNYKVIVKKDIDHTIKIPDTWENVKIDLDGNTITGDKATDTDEAKPGLEYIKDNVSTEHPGTKLEIINGTIKGGEGSEKYPNGAAGVGTAEGADKPEKAGIEAGKNAEIIGGNGADAKNDTAGNGNGNGGNGGAGIKGDITPTVNGGNVTGGNGGKGSDASTGTPGNGGNGGNGIETINKVTVKEGTVTGGDAGNGGNATGDNTNAGGSGGTGGTGIDSTEDIIIGPSAGRTEVIGGNGGNGGSSENGDGGNAGNGGNGTKTEGKTENNGGTTAGGNGGNGGNSNSGNGGNGGNGGNASIGGTENTTGGSSNGGNGGNGGSGKNPGNGGSGGTGENGNGGNGNNGNANNTGSNENTGNNGNTGSNENTGNNGSQNNSGNAGNNSNSTIANVNGNISEATGENNNTTDIAAADADNTEKKNPKKYSNKKNQKSDSADSENVTDNTVTDSTEEVTEKVNEDTEENSDENKNEITPVDNHDTDEKLGFSNCGFHWYPMILILLIAVYTGIRMKKIREELDE